jgi:hypothetical protein
VLVVLGVLDHPINPVLVGVPQHFLLSHLLVAEAVLVLTGTLLVLVVRAAVVTAMLQLQGRLVTHHLLHPRKGTLVGMAYQPKMAGVLAEAVLVLLAVMQLPVTQDRVVLAQLQV